MKLKYIGRHEAVEVDLPDGGGFTVENGQETPALPDDVAFSLLEQEANWQASDADSSYLAQHLAAQTPEPEQDEQDEHTGDDHDEEDAE